MPGSIRLFVEAALHSDASVTLSEAQAHYLGNVMRRGPDDRVRLFNGRDGEFQGRIAELRRGRVVVRLDACLRPQEDGADPWLVFAVLKRDASDLLVRMATELGVAALLPVFTERTNTDRAAIARWRVIAIEAAEQCERLSVPAIREPVRLPGLLRDWPDGRRLIAAIERADAPPIAPAGGRPAALLVGPEGGFTAAELDALHRCAFVVPATLGPLVLRAETAAIAGLALLQASAPLGIDEPSH